MASALANDFGDIRLRIAEFIAKPLVARRFFEGIEIGALDVFDDRKFERLAVVGVKTHDGHFMESCAFRRAPSALAGDDFVSIKIAGQRARKDGLKNSIFLDGG